MKGLLKGLLAAWTMMLTCTLPAWGQTLEEAFRCPPQEARPLMIWQWMDGMVNAEGITADLEAYKEAGLGGVQQFLVGGPMQTLVRDTTNAVGTDRWARLMRHAISECRRLGLSFGTHNCPGWSSSAFPAVSAEFSMQQIVWTDTIVNGGRLTSVAVRQPDTDSRFGFYSDIAVLAMPDEGIVKLSDIIDLTGKTTYLLPKGVWRVLRFGHTTNGKTNEATAPYGGVGLECDKMSREAVKRYWDTYPTMLLNIMPEEVGNTFQRIEIDSYEAGGQSWTRLMPEEFLKRRGYDMLKWLPVIAGHTVEGETESKRFFSDYARTGTELFTENYYGYMSELAHESGLKLLYQPYGTNSSKPFNPIDTEGIAGRLKDDFFCTEFWTNPQSWGWPSVPRHMQTVHRHGIRLVFAEGFTCWPLSAWQEDPASQKVLADRAFCLGVNALMLHAGAQNPWVGALPGMTFGKWGSWWTPGQTWWRSGGAKLLFDYMSRCQALLQRGSWVDDHTVRTASLQSDIPSLQWTHRKDGEADIYFISNPLDSACFTTLQFPASGRLPEVWLPESGTMGVATDWRSGDGVTKVLIHFDEHQSAFIIFRKPTDEEGAGNMQPVRQQQVSRQIALDRGWELSFPSGWDAPEKVLTDSLVAWNEHDDMGIRYFSGTATYNVSFSLKKVDRKARYVLRLGEVKNLAKVSVNGSEVAHLWKKPFCCDITENVRKGENEIEIEVTNLWCNRMIGDEQYEDDMEWADDDSFGRQQGGSQAAGQYLKSVPSWLANGEARKSVHRKTVVSYKYFSKDSKLLPSGLIGPVVIDVEK